MKAIVFLAGFVGSIMVLLIGCDSAGGGGGGGATASDSCVASDQLVVNGIETVTEALPSGAADCDPRLRAQYWNDYVGDGKLINVVVQTDLSGMRYGRTVFNANMWGATTGAYTYGTGSTAGTFQLTYETAGGSICTAGSGTVNVDALGGSGEAISGTFDVGLTAVFGTGCPSDIDGSFTARRITMD
jgi:hypothetical protein